MQQFLTPSTPKFKMKVFLTLQEKFDILHEAYCVPDAIKSTAQKYNIDPVQTRQYQQSISSLNLESGNQMLAMISRNGQAKKTFTMESLALMQNTLMHFVPNLIHYIFQADLYL